MFLRLTEIIFSKPNDELRRIPPVLLRVWRNAAESIVAGEIIAAQNMIVAGGQILDAMKSSSPRCNTGTSRQLPPKGLATRRT